MFEKVSPQFTFAEKEQQTLDFWRENDIFQKSMEMYKDAQPFVFLEGPPFANAPPGVHHVLARIMKDAVCRYKTMTGHYVHRKAGWDTHGLPVEYQVEKQLNITNKAELEAYGVRNFIEKCKENVFQYEQDWRRMTERIGFWVNLDEAYITLSNDYIESVWWVLRQAWDKGLLYQGHKVQPYCYRCGTTLASHEVALGYQEVADPSIFVRFPLKNRENTYLLVWTTTPWTLPSNVAVAVGEDYDYVVVEQNGQNLILAKECISNLFGDELPQIVESYKGSDLQNWEYEPLFDSGQHGQQLNIGSQASPRAHYVVTGDFVTTTEGSGLVHIAPAFGQDDYDIGQKYNLPFVQLVGADGTFIEEVKKARISEDTEDEDLKIKGKSVKEADQKIIKNLDGRGLLFKDPEEYTHQYPFCWRCDNPLLYYARESWFIRTTAIRDQMLENNKEINWYPEHIKDGRFGNWLENNIDWGLSRERYWGTPLPVWICDDCGHQHCVGSIAELKESGTDVPEDIELHRPYVDDVVLTCEKCSGTMHRVQDVIDCWFDSGCAHTAQWHYPFENKELFEQAYPPDFISEAIDQTRGWFYSLLATGTLLYDKPAYKNCLCLELVMGPDGQKMSKSRGNTVDPWTILDEQGADALRWYMFTASPPWAQRTFKPEGIDEALKKFMGTLQNVYSFFVMYANLEIAGEVSQPHVPWQDAPPVAERAIVDRWILSRLNTLINKVCNDMENYQLTNAPRAIEAFVDDLSNWYVRRSRDRFWGAEAGQDKQAAYATLYEVLITVAKLAAPFIPFLADELYRNLVGSLNHDAPLSVHLTEYPTADDAAIDAELENDMAFTRDVISMGHAARNRSGIKTRQPLAEITLGGLSDTEKETINRLAAFVLDELNVKKIVFTEDLDAFAQVTLKPNFKVLGPIYGKGVQAIAKELANADAMQKKAELEADGELKIKVAGETLTLDQSEIDVQTQNREGFFVEADARKFVALSTELTHALELEGMARELVNKIQNMRKDADFNVSDRIKLSVKTESELVKEAFKTHREYILTETLTTEVVESPGESAFSLDQKLNGEVANLSVERV